jgi:CBS domain containing-hemolysin-like protein
VYEDTIDNIIGLALAKDLIPILRSPPADFSLREIMRPVHVVPGSREVEEVLADFKRLKEHMAIVLDEYGGTAGIVTIEDLLEEIVGEIQDEYDTEKPSVEPIDDKAFLVDGGVSMSTINELLEVDLESDAYDTIGGLIYSQLGAEPHEGEKAIVGPLQATVVAMDGRRVRRVRVERLDEPSPADAASGAA